jgi:flavodoxin
LKTLIVCVSKYYGNTLKIAKTIASVLEEAEIVKPKEAEVERLSEFDLIGFGSGIYFGKHDLSLLEFVDKLPMLNKRVFIFSTRGRIGLFENIFHKALRDKLIKQGFNVVGEFSCRGFSDYHDIFKLFGGVNKGKPNDEDLRHSKNFALNLKQIRKNQV